MIKLEPDLWAVSNAVPERMIDAHDQVRAMIKMDIYQLNLMLTEAGLIGIPDTYTAKLHDQLEGGDPEDPHFRDPLKGTYVDEATGETIEFERPRYMIMITVRGMEREDTIGVVINSLLDHFKDAGREITSVWKEALKIIAATVTEEDDKGRRIKVTMINFPEGFDS